MYPSTTGASSSHPAAGGGGGAPSSRFPQGSLFGTGSQMRSSQPGPSGAQRHQSQSSAAQERAQQQPQLVLSEEQREEIREAVGPLSRLFGLVICSSKKNFSFLFFFPFFFFHFFYLSSGNT